MGGAPLKYAKGALSNVSAFGHKRPPMFMRLKLTATGTQICHPAGVDRTIGLTVMYNRAEAPFLTVYNFWAGQ